MKILILSDIHSNLEALTAVLADAETKGYDSVVCLGDFVGYGADPNECVRTFSGLSDAVAVLGNHDAAVLSSVQRDVFNPVARTAIVYSESQLDEESVTYLKGLPLVVDSNPDFLAVHASPYQPEAWVYVLEPLEAADAFHVMSHPLAFIGHTHFPAVHIDNGAVLPFMVGDHVTVEDGKKFLVNVGSVGQPRDGDARAAYVIYDSDTKTATIFRVDYDVDRAAQKILDAGLPPMLADRLRRGY